MKVVEILVLVLALLIIPNLHPILFASVSWKIVTAVAIMLLTKEWEHGAPQERERESRFDFESRKSIAVLIKQR